MNNISGFGLQIRLTASVTMPGGITLTQFADDSDPFDLPSVQQADAAAGLNGDLITWSKAGVIKVTCALIPSGTDDKNLSIIAQANRPAPGVKPAQDRITVTAVYPNGETLRLINGVLTDAMPGRSVASAGRFKTGVYGFAFETYEIV